MNLASSVPHFFSPAAYSSWRNSKGHSTLLDTWFKPGSRGGYLSFCLSFSSVHAGALVSLPLEEEASVITDRNKLTYLKSKVHLNSRLRACLG